MSAIEPETLALRVLALLRPIGPDTRADAPASSGVRVVASGALPTPARTLLDHADGMTPTLERHWGRRLELHVLADRRAGSELDRHVQLVTADERRVASFGAIHLELERFAPEARAAILASRIPLGTILRDHRVVHRRRVSGFFEVAAARLAHARLATDGVPRLYGRHSVLVSPTDELMAEVVEILPPLDGHSLRDR